MGHDYLYRTYGAWEVALLSAVASAILLVIFSAAARGYPKLLKRRNFRGDLIPVTGGFPLLLLPLVLSALSYWAAHSSNNLDSNAFIIFAFAAAAPGFAAVGLIDDIYGDRSVGGFRGHFRRFFKERRVTTGLIKVVVGGCLALVAGMFYVMANLHRLRSDLGAVADPIFHHPYGATVFYGVFIALSANTFNLIDLRPGRCATAASVLCVAALIFSGGNTVAAVLAGILLTLLPFDRAGQLMLGDSGSNALGAGLAVCYLSILGHWQVAAAIFGLAVFQVWCEKHSLSAFIESKPLLRSIDRKIGVR